MAALDYDKGGYDGYFRMMPREGQVLTYQYKYDSNDLLNKRIYGLDNG